MNGYRMVLDTSYIGLIYIYIIKMEERKMKKVIANFIAFSILILFMISIAFFISWAVSTLFPMHFSLEQGFAVIFVVIFIKLVFVFFAWDFKFKN